MTTKTRTKKKAQKEEAVMETQADMLKRYAVPDVTTVDDLVRLGNALNAYVVASLTDEPAGEVRARYVWLQEECRALHPMRRDLLAQRLHNILAHCLPDADPLNLLLGAFGDDDDERAALLHEPSEDGEPA